MQPLTPPPSLFPTSTTVEWGGEPKKNLYAKNNLLIENKVITVKKIIIKMKKQVMSNATAHYPLTNAKNPPPEPTPGNSSVYILGMAFLW